MISLLRQCLHRPIPTWRVSQGICASNRCIGIQHSFASSYRSPRGSTGSIRFKHDDAIIEYGSEPEVPWSERPPRVTRLAPLVETILGSKAHEYPLQNAVDGPYNLNETHSKLNRKGHGSEPNTLSMHQLLQGITTNLRQAIVGDNNIGILSFEEPSHLIEEDINQLSQHFQDEQKFKSLLLAVSPTRLVPVCLHLVNHLINDPSTLSQHLSTMVQILDSNNVLDLDGQKNVLYRFPQYLSYLYHLFLLKSHIADFLPPAFYMCFFRLLQCARNHQKWSLPIPLALPSYYLHLKCPPELRQELQVVLKDATVHPPMHWESLLLAGQTVARQGHLKTALRLYLSVLNHTYHAKYTVEFHNALLVLLRAAQEEKSDMAPPHLLLAIIDDLAQTGVFFLDSTLQELIRYSVQINSWDGLLQLSHLLQNNRRPRATQVEYDLAYAMRRLDMDVVQMQLVSPSPVVYRPDRAGHKIKDKINLSVKTQFFLMASKHLEDNGEAQCYDQILAHFEADFKTDYISLLGLPCSSVSQQGTAHPTSQAVAKMIDLYFRQHDNDPGIVQKVCENFLASLDYSKEVVRIATWAHPAVHNAILAGIGRSRHPNSSKYCLALLEDLLKSHDPIANFPTTFPQSMKDLKVTAGPDATTWSCIIRLFLRNGQTQAAEKVLDQVWYRAPNYWTSCAGFLYRHYAMQGNLEKIEQLNRRRDQSGLEGPTW